MSSLTATECDSGFLWFDGQCRLDIVDLERVAQPLTVRLTPEARDAVGKCERFVYHLASQGRPIYGLTTGFGPLAAYQANPDASAHGRGLINFLRAGHGETLDPAVVRAMLLARLWSLAQGHSGVGLHAIDGLSAVLASDFAPVVPEFGSVGASGDLAPLAYAIAALMGDGMAWVGGRLQPAAEALSSAGLAPLHLHGRDALGLVNGTSLTSAAAGLAVLGARRAIRVALRLSALLVETLGASAEFADSDLLDAFGHHDGSEIARLFHGLLAGMTPPDDAVLQQKYSIRCVPQILSAVAASVRHAERTIIDDLNGISDNPVFFPTLDKVVHGGNFFGQPAAFASDALNIAMVQLANLAERQLDLLVDPARNGGLPPFLSPKPGAQSGLTGLNIATTATVAHMRRMATPASIQSLPTNLHNQDIVPLGTQAALEARRQVTRLQWIQGSLAVALRQAAYVGGREPASKAGTRLLAQLSELLAPIDPDRPLDDDIRRAASLIYNDE